MIKHLIANVKFFWEAVQLVWFERATRGTPVRFRAPPGLMSWWIV